MAILVATLLLCACGSGGGSPLSSEEPQTNETPSEDEAPGPPSTPAPVPDFSDTVSPYLISTRPLPNAVDVPLNAAIVLTFSEPMDRETAQAAVSVVSRDNEGNETPVNCVPRWTSDSRVLDLAPAEGWAPTTQFTAFVSRNATDIAGNRLVAEANLNFGTGTAMDITPPRVTITKPTDEAAGQAVNLPLTVCFSEPMDSTTVEGAITLVGDGAIVSGTFAWSNANQLLVFTPSDDLVANTSYLLSIGTEAVDLAGNAMTSTFQLSFSTGEGEGSIVNVGEGITGTDRDGDGVIDEYNLDLNQLTEQDLQGALDDPEFQGTVSLSADPPVTFEVPLYVNRDGLNIQVFPTGSVTLDGEAAIETIVHIGGDDIVVDGLAVTEGLGDLIAQSVDEEGNSIPIQNLVLRNLTVAGSETDDCIQLNQCENCTIEHVKAYNCYSHGISATGGSNITVRESEIGCGGRPDCIYGAYSNMGFLHFFKTHNVNVHNVEIYDSVRRPGGSGGGFAVKFDETSGNISVTGLSVHDNFNPPANAPYEDGGAGTAVVGVVQHGTDKSEASVTISSVTLTDNKAPAFYFERHAEFDSLVVVDGAYSAGNTGFMTTDDQQSCIVKNSLIEESGVTTTSPCSDGGGNTFASP